MLGLPVFIYEGKEVFAFAVFVELVFTFVVVVEEGGYGVLVVVFVMGLEDRGKGEVLEESLKKNQIKIR